MAKVLLVEDDNNLREIYSARLQAEGYEISSAADGEEALVVAKQQKPDLIISDVMMPKISGFEMLDILRNTEGLQHVKVVMLTALGQAEDRNRADSLGADKYLVKSQVTLEDIVKTARDLLNPPTAGAASGVQDTVAVNAVATAAPAPTAPTAAPTQAEVTPSPEPTNNSAPAPESNLPQHAADQPSPPSAATPAAESSDAGAITAGTSATPGNDQTLPGSVAQEQAIVEEQINQFAATAVDTPAPGSQPETVNTPVEAPSAGTDNTVAAQPAAAPVGAADAQPATAPPAAAASTQIPVIEPVEPPIDPPEPTAEAAKDAADTTVLENAVQELAAAGTAPQASPIAARVEAPTEATAAPAPAASSETTKTDDESNDHVPIPGKKVIQPPPKENKPDLNELLAREVAKASEESNPSPPTNSSLSQTTPAPGTASSSIDPNKVAL